ncbi:hypothetical protein ABZ705_21375 [Streptomyces sp. NPDC006984]|uniref:hypothetical protein n=1 Tax=Streptomyces sp. NPDC006984 TaxID=3155463 RepID=UPI0033DB8461
MTIEVYADRFMQKALDAMGDDPEQILHAGRIVASAGLDAADEGAVVSHLVVGRWVERAVNQANGRSPLIRLTRTGASKARELRANSDSRAEREAHLNNRLLYWAYDNSPSGGSADLQMFAASKDWWFCGTEVAWNEVYAAVAYLKVKLPRASGVRYAGIGSGAWLRVLTRCDGHAHSGERCGVLPRLPHP